MKKYNLVLDNLLSVTRHSSVFGVLVYDRADYEKRKARGEKIKISRVGLQHLASVITPELASEVVESLQVRGVFTAREAVKIALSGRLK